jgi:hypothetical protein
MKTKSYYAASLTENSVLKRFDDGEFSCEKISFFGILSIVE